MIHIQGLVKRHRSIEILRGASFDVAKGEVAAVIGASGSGKSTLMRCVNGLESFQEGSIVVDGLRLDSTSTSIDRETVIRQVCRRVGMVFQAYHLFPHRTVLQNVTEGPIYVLRMAREAAEQRAIKLLDRVGLRTRINARPRELSGGEQQRVAIARALALEPLAILFDEPTSALDPRMTTEMIAVINDLARDGLTMIVVTHAMRFARSIAQTVHVLSEGVIVESGPPEQVFESPQALATRQLLNQECAS